MRRLATAGVQAGVQRGPYLCLQAGRSEVQKVVRVAHAGGKGEPTKRLERLRSPARLFCLGSHPPTLRGMASTESRLLHPALQLAAPPTRPGLACQGSPSSCHTARDAPALLPNLASGDCSC